MKVISVQVYNRDPGKKLKERLDKLGEIDIKYVVQTHYEARMPVEDGIGGKMMASQLVTTVTVFFEKK